jgi:hypothetical protein
VKIAHIINSVKVHEKNELFVAQQVTFSTMNRSKDWCNGNAEINFYSAQFEEDRSVLPEFITPLTNLKRSVLDVNQKLQGKKLPLIADILEKAKEISSFDYLIYTNADIALMPHFYDFVTDYLSKGHDAIVINRRRISGSYSFPEDLNLMYSDIGRSHPGFDCFVVKKELIDQFVFDNICIGVPFLEVSFVHNIASFASNPLYIMDAHLTFHLGTEVLPKGRKNAFYWHNRSTYFTKIRPKLAPHFKLSGFPYFNKKIPLRSLKWVLNPALFTREYIQLERNHIVGKWRSKWIELRWRLLQR